jgi:hypothetical protein
MEISAIARRSYDRESLNMGELGSLSSKLCTSLSIFTLKDVNGAPAWAHATAMDLTLI